MSSDSPDHNFQVPNTGSINLSPSQRASIARKKATCPFMASAVGTGNLAVRNSAGKPLAAIQDIVDLGDSGGGDLGSKVLRIFATGNHSRMQGPSGNLDVPTPPGMMSLDLAGSRGAHPGHSGILLGDPTKIDGGRLSAENFERLKNHGDKDGYLSEQAIGEFIVENLARDPDSKVLPIGRLTVDLLGIFDEIGDSLTAKLLGRQTERDEVEFIEKLTRLAGEDNLIGSAGEFGLLFAFLANRPDPDRKDNRGIRLSDVEQMFVHQKLPEDWETWKKSAKDWVHATTRITAAAVKAHLRKRKED